jgi:hypothetical protein
MNRPQQILYVWLISLGLCLISADSDSALAQVQSVGPNGFEIRVAKSTSKSALDCDRAFIEEFGKWWSSDHTWSGKAENLAIDQKQGVLIERLPAGGFCRHLTLEHYQPGKLILLTGGLGPLKEMGLNGTMSVRFAEKEGQTSIEVKYLVHGYSPNGFKELSAAVHQVLEMQIGRWIAYSETGNPVPAAKN